MSRSIFQRLSATERTEILRALRNETASGVLLLLGAVAALVWANSRWHAAYDNLQHTIVGPAALGLDLSLHDWAADGLLAVFFLVAGLELKRELVLGDLSDPSKAVVPVIAAACGMAVPVIVYLVVNTIADGSYAGWAVPIATDIAFALAVLAVTGSHLPATLRAFLLTLAVVDDLLAIVVIAVFFTEDLNLVSLAGAAALLAVYALLQRRRVSGWRLYVLLGLGVWVLVHQSGVHATVAGLAIGLLTRARHDPGERESPTERYEHAMRPLSAGVCVPVFALMAAGVTVTTDSLADVFTGPIPLGVVLGLVIGKSVGVLGGTWLTARFTRAELSDDVEWADILGVALLSGTGFTVSLLIGELAFEGDDPTIDLVKSAVLAGSLIAAVLGASVLLVRNGVYRRLNRAESAAPGPEHSARDGGDT